jgi:hypothetical protein
MHDVHVSRIEGMSFATIFRLRLRGAHSLTSRAVFCARTRIALLNKVILRCRPIRCVFAR